MNLGSIPGYYYDQEKKKYFKITADHGLETGQKYTKSNVRYEKQVAKKRKVEQRDQRKRQAQTIKRSRLLSIPEYAGVGLHRETGVRSLTVDRAHADEAFVSQLRYEDIYTTHGTVLSAHPLPSTSHTLLTQVGGQDSSYIFSTDGDISHSLRARWPKALGDSELVHYTAFPGLAMSTSVWPAQDPQKLLACTSGGVENVFIGSLAHEDRILRPDIKLSIGNDETTLWDSAISSTGETAAIAGSDRIIHLSMEGRILSRLPKAANSRSVSWLNSSTIAASSGKQLLLWDTRTHGYASRFSCRSAITGVQTVPSSGGNQLLLSTNQNLALQDTRMLRHASKPVLDFSILHEGPQLIFDVNDRDLIAFSHKEGRKDEIRLLSLRTGQQLRTLQVPGPVNQKRPTQLVWREDERGVEFLQACMGSTIGKWCWNSDDA